ncbi:transcription factor Sox-1-like [Catharus ustulatus]|uniref:transcription factor Sox-1-like n=1 Tax=Catharus ustulatus TaxID=91951 RepID=UPI00140B0C9E|nr:transcription factor Sox-1-like [Catharus ustulatus]
MSHLQRKTSTRRDPFSNFEVQRGPAEDGEVVIHVLNSHFNVENVQRVVHQHLEADRTGRRLATHLLPVQSPVHVQVPVLLIHREVLLLLAQPQLARRQLVRAQPQVPRQRPHERASAQLLGDGVADPLGRRPPPHAQQHRAQQRSPAARPQPLPPPHRHSLPPPQLAALPSPAAAPPPFQQLSPGIKENVESQRDASLFLSPPLSAAAAAAAGGAAAALAGAGRASSLRGQDAAAAAAPAPLGGGQQRHPEAPPRHCSRRMAALKGARLWAGLSGCT